MATHSSILAQKIPWTEEPGRLQSTGSQRVSQPRLSGWVHMNITNEYRLYPYFSVSRDLSSKKVPTGKMMSVQGFTIACGKNSKKDDLWKGPG